MCTDYNGMLCLFKNNVTFYKTETHSEDIKGKGILLGKAERDTPQKQQSTCQTKIIFILYT